MKSKKEKIIEKIWDFLRLLVLLIVFAFCLAATIAPEIILWQAIANGDAPWWIIFVGR